MQDSSTEEEVLSSEENVRVHQSLIPCQPKSCDYAASSAQFKSSGPGSHDPGRDRSKSDIRVYNARTESSSRLTYDWRLESAH